jgi:ligand-binding SRPBCC domain-containing protein
VNFQRSFKVDAPISLVANFHADPRALQRLTPPPILMRPGRMEPLTEGSISEFVMWLGPFPVRWVARHSSVSQAGFTDEQLEGPFKRWVHHHRYEALAPDQSLVTDDISAELSDRLLARLLGAVMWLGLPILFAYRAWRTRVELARMMAEGVG